MQFATQTLEAAQGGVGGRGMHLGVGKIVREKGGVIIYLLTAFCLLSSEAGLDVQCCSVPGAQVDRESLLSVTCCHLREV